jgi:hypothetical protein
MIREFLCWLRGGHRWQVHQTLVTPDWDAAFVLAWKQCPHCAASKLIHILR